MTVSRAELENPVDLQQAHEKMRQIANFESRVRKNILEVISFARGQKPRHPFNFFTRFNPAADRNILHISRTVQDGTIMDSVKVGGKYFEFGSEEAEKLVERIISKACGSNPVIDSDPTNIIGSINPRVRRIDSLGIEFRRFGDSSNMGTGDEDTFGMISLSVVAVPRPKTGLFNPKVV